MGVFGKILGGPKSGPSAEEIRAQEEARQRAQAQKFQETQELRRRALRGSQQEDEEEGEIRRKRLFGE